MLKEKLEQKDRRNISKRSIFFKRFPVFLAYYFLIALIFSGCDSEKPAPIKTDIIIINNKISLSFDLKEDKELKFYSVPAGTDTTALVSNNFVTNIDTMGLVEIGYTNVTTIGGTDTLADKTFIGVGVRLGNAADFITNNWQLHVYAQGHDFADGTEIVYATEGNGKVFKTICNDSGTCSDAYTKVNNQLWNDLRFMINADVPNGSYSGTIVFEIYTTP